MVVTKMMSMLLPRSRAGNIALGAAGAALLPSVTKPLLHGVVKAGYAVKALVVNAWDSAKDEAAKIRSEVSSSSSSGRTASPELEEEVRRLREELHELKAAKKSH